jgi:hypothetical protein
MSGCGGLVVGALAFPLALVVLLVAGVSYLALQGAGLACRGAISGLEFAGSKLGPAVRAATEALSAAGTTMLSATTGAADWTRTLLDTSVVRDRIRHSLRNAYTRGLGGTADLATVGPATERPGALTTGGSVTASMTLSIDERIPAVESPGTTASMRAPIAAPAAGTEGDAGATTADTLARAKAIRTVLDSEVPLALVADHRSRAGLAEASRAIAASEAALRAGDAAMAKGLAASAERALTTATYDAYQHLVKAERATVAAQVGNSLQDLGYQVRVAHSTRGIALVGRKQHYALAMVLRAGGRVSFDMSGFEQTSCHPEARALLGALGQNGLVLSSAEINWHGRLDGGPLIRAAMRKGRPLEQALAEMAPASAETGRLADGDRDGLPVRRQTRLASGPDDYERGRAWMWGNVQRQKGVTR